GGKQTIFSNHCIMPNVNEVVNFCTRSNDCIAAYATINSTTGTYFYKIINDHSAAAVHFFIVYVTVCFFIVIKCIAANNTARLYHYLVTNYTMIQYGNVWINNAAVSNIHMISNICAGHYNCSL